MAGNPSEDATAEVILPNDLQCFTRKWYFSREEIEHHSPSRKDGIENEMESAIRELYCSFCQELGRELKVSQIIVGIAIMLCHRFYLRQSHAKNDWQIIATVSIFLACKSEDTPRKLSDVVVVAYKLTFRWDPSAPRRIRQRDVLAKQEELILTGERLLLSTIAFDLNVQLPYQPLVAVLKRLNISNKELARAAWSLVNDWLHTTLCLQYKPHCVAAGSLFLAAKFLNVELPAEGGNVWWFQFEVSPKQLKAVVHDMLCLLEKKWKAASPPVHGSGVESKTAMPNIPQPAIRSDSGSMPHGSTIGEFVNSTTSGITRGSSVAEGTVPKAMANSDRHVKSATPSTPQSCFVTGSNACRCTAQGAVVDAAGVVNYARAKFSASGASSDFNGPRKESLFCQPSSSGRANSAVEDGDGQPKSRGSDHNPGFKIVPARGGYIKPDVNRTRDLIKKRKGNGTVNKKLAEASRDDEIERELADGIELQGQAASKNKKRRF